MSSEVPFAQYQRNNLPHTLTTRQQEQSPSGSHGRTVQDCFALKDTYNHEIILHCIILFLLMPSLGFTKSF